jgi:hypothetical protein
VRCGFPPCQDTSQPIQAPYRASQRAPVAPCPALRARETRPTRKRGNAPTRFHAPTRLRGFDNRGAFVSMSFVNSARRPEVRRLCPNCRKKFERTNAKQRYCGRKCYMAAYRAANRNSILKHKAAYRAANRARIAKQRAAYRAANRARVAKQRAAYRAANRKRLAKRQAAYRAANRGRITAYYRRNRARILKCQAAYRPAKRLSQAKIRRH